MSSLPIILPSGVVAIYGYGYTNSYNGIAPDNIIFKFGTVYDIWAGGAAYIYGGDQVMWKEGDEQCKLAYSGNPYTLIEAKLVTKQVSI